MVTIRIPAPPKGLGTNLLGVVSLLALVVAVGGLTGSVWWALLTAGLLGFGVTVLAQAGARPAQEIPDNVRSHRRPAVAKAA